MPDFTDGVSGISASCGTLLYKERKPFFDAQLAVQHVTFFSVHLMTQHSLKGEKFLR